MKKPTLSAPKLFKPEDFQSTSRICVPNKVSVTLIEEIQRASFKEAQQIFEAWLAEQPVVRGWVNSDGNVGFGSEGNRVNPDADTHTAQLVNIQPLAKEACEHKRKMGEGFAMVTALRLIVGNVVQV